MSTTIALISIGVAVLFIIGIKFLSSPKTARTGNLVAAAGMFIALLALHKTDGNSVWTQGWSFNYTLIAIGIVVGLVIGAVGAYSVKMTAMPQMVALFNGLGGGAAALVASLEFLKRAHGNEYSVTVNGSELLHVSIATGNNAFIAGSMLFATLIGSLSFSGSIIAYLKLQGKFEKPHTFPGQNFLNGLILLVILGLCGWLTFHSDRRQRRHGFRRHVLPRAVFWRGDGAAHRRRGHAGGDFVAQFVHRPGGGGGRFCHQQSRDGRRRHARRFVRHVADAAHVQGDESSGDQCFVRRVRLRRRRQGGGGRRGRNASNQFKPTKPRCCSPMRSAW